jgi:hypothetical protein
MKPVPSATVSAMPEQVAHAARGVPDAQLVRPRTPVVKRFRRIVEYRELLVGMTRKELKVKYKNSVLGLRGRCSTRCSTSSSSTSRSS